MDPDTIVKFVHYCGFAGCAVASLWKNALLRATVLQGRPLKTLLALDRVSGASALVILLSGLGLTLWFAKPTGMYTANQLYLLKVSLFGAASIAVLFTKPLIRRAIGTDRLYPTMRIRLLLMLDLGLILAVAVLGRVMVHGAIFSRDITARRRSTRPLAPPPPRNRKGRSHAAPPSFIGSLRIRSDSRPWRPPGGDRYRC